MIPELSKQYKELIEMAERAFAEMQRGYGDRIKCRRGCADCCHAVFGLFLIEAAYIKERFDRLDRAAQEEILQRAARMDEELERMHQRLARFADEPVMQAYALSRERVRCPLLNDKEECVLYSFRPITCRVYGIPVTIHGRAQVCWKAGFAKGESYPAFDLDAVYKVLYRLSKELMESAGQNNTEPAAMLISVSKALKMPYENLVRGEFG
ncbi:MAG: YkgJ family cysteine cluster protein [Bacillota bacterium]